MTITEFRFDANGSIIEPEIDLRQPTADPETQHRIAFSSGDTATVVGADTYQPEGPMTTFFTSGSNRGVIDSWSVRIASYRTADIISISRVAAADAVAPSERPTGAVLRAIA